MPQSASRYYFRAPTFDTDPESTTSGRPGSIFTRFGKLTNPLNQHDVVAIPPSSTSASRVPKFQEVVKKGISGSAGISGALSHTLVSSKVLYTFAKDKTATYNCAAMETYEFEANEQYVTDSITASLRVQNFIADSFTGKSSQGGFPWSIPSKVIFAYRAIEIAPKRDGKLGYKDIRGGQYSYGEEEGEEEEEGWDIEPVKEKQMLEMYAGALPVLVDAQ
ncbi:hypothetical protein MAC_02162 [Metarhizium acridum CQMa 102]|uniref:Uncharacterized protein n=1 Tax=Metarhizium acridum (strain CQMa 102) TaxID=655827 RepID=E9DX14_METAQ|nr:uncharacterized protein MAC_02162 [Metarhizium acridum CQMa 102]EFY91877.1 hypothetical protein MAC_02162 [Metarhizium acridum CQMa 102]